MVDYDLFLKQTAGRVSVITGELAICHRTIKHIPKETVESLSSEQMFALGMKLGALYAAAKDYCDSVCKIAGVEPDLNAFDFTLTPTESNESDS